MNSCTKGRDYLLKEVKAQFLRRFLQLSFDHLEELEANVCPILGRVILLEYKINFLEF